MPGTTRVDLHCHSTCSDGKLSPLSLVDLLARQGVGVAALTDHDTVAGQAEFRDALGRKGIAWIAGLEMTTRHRGQEIHILVYGIDITNAELLATLASLRQARRDYIQSIEASFRKLPGVSGGESVAANGTVDTTEAIRLIHRAGGRAFLAHPYLVSEDPAVLRAVVRELKAAGLDGIEAVYAAYNAERRAALIDLARDEGLLSSAGSDFHGPEEPGHSAGIDMPTELWKPFRDLLLRDRPAEAGASSASVASVHRPGWRRFNFHIVFPTVLAMVLFAAAIWGFLLPSFEQSLLDRKREMIRELTNSTMGIIAEAHRQELAGKMTREQAQHAAAAQIESLRYGREAKDYFWLQDLHPRMIMHPYRLDLNGQDLSDFKDARGARIFVEFADVVRRRGEGYIEYVWQWKDDPLRLSAKESYVRGFQPWGWIIGTGIYTDDVRQEIARVERNLVRGSLLIVAVLAALLLYVMIETIHLERDRSAAERHQRETTERYVSLLAATTEGTLLVTAGRCRYANPTLLKMLGRTPHEVELLDLEDVLPADPPNAPVWEKVRQVERGEDPAGSADARLLSRDGRQLDCIVTVSPIRFGDTGGIVLLVRDAAHRPLKPVSGTIVIRHEDGEKLAAEIASAGSADEVVALCRRTPGMAAQWLAAGMHPRYITSAITSVCDAATGAFINLAMAELGPAPARFSLVAMGSQARREQSLFTDQDNAFLLADDADPGFAGPYFEQLGRRVCAGLDRAGYAFCRGHVMAQTEKWRQPLAVWKRHFRDWIGIAEPKALLDLSIFFDLRTIWGDMQLAADLRNDTNLALRESPAFFPHFAQNALLFKPPMQLFGMILPTGGEHTGQIDLKAAMMPIVSFARLYALRHELPPTNTLERIAAMAAAGVLSESTQQDLTQAYEFLMRLRLQRQLSQLESAMPVDNSIDHHQLSHTERTLLKEAFTQIEAVQKKISYDFLGGT